MKTLLHAFSCYVFTATACLAAGNVSVETLGAIKYPGVSGDAVYGAGLVGSYQFHRTIAGWVRGIAYSTPDHWRGPALDEASAGVDVTLLTGWFGGTRLGAIGGLHRSLGSHDLGVGIGLRGSAQLYQSVHLFAQGEFRGWDKAPADTLVSFGLALQF